eukprot:scaffold71173_cov100-Phaeocystis_antarctica.AAC.3
MPRAPWGDCHPRQFLIYTPNRGYAGRDAQRRTHTTRDDATRLRADISMRSATTRQRQRRWRWRAGDSRGGEGEGERQGSGETLGLGGGKDTEVAR